MKKEIEGMELTGKERKWAISQLNNVFNINVLENERVILNGGTLLVNHKGAIHELLIPKIKSLGGNNKN